MFKAKLIENENYYKLRSKQLLLFFLLVVPTGIIANLYKAPIWLIVIIIGLFTLMIVLMNRNQKRLKSVLRNKLIEIEENEIRIKSKNGMKKEIIKLDNVEKLILKDEYTMPQETMKDLKNEMTGKANQNYLILYQENKKRKLDFEFDSYFMLEELKKIINSWEVKGYHIERIRDL